MYLSNTMVIWRFVVLQAKLLESLSAVRGAGGKVKARRGERENIRNAT